VSEELNQVKAAFQEHMALVGVDISGESGITAKCVTGQISRKREQQVVAMLGEAATRVSMLNEDFHDLQLDPNKSLVTINDIQFRVLTVTSDPTDPITDFLVVAEH
jgi:hypothetical protein